MRLRYWDIVKGITIVLMILGHVGGVNPYVRKIIFTYHMPLFFIANAYFIKNYNIKENIVKSAKSLLVPYGVVALIAAGISVMYNTSGIANHTLFMKRIVDMFLGLSYVSKVCVDFESVWLIWFVICLFAARILYIALMKILQKVPEWLTFCILLLISYIGMQIGLQGYFFPWSFDVAMAALIFMWVGDFLHKKDILDHKRMPVVYGICFIIWVVLGFGDFQIELSLRMYPGELFSIVEAITGSIVFIGVARFIEKYLHKFASFFEWCGKNSMIILAIHCLEMRFFNLPFQGSWWTVFVLQLIVILGMTWLFLEFKKGIQYLNNIER